MPPNERVAGGPARRGVPLPAAAPPGIIVGVAASPARLRFLVTAGPTREYIDPVRFISNDSSGRMGYALAAAAIRRGHRVTLVHGPVALPPVRHARMIAVVSARDMLRACRAQWPDADVLIMAAAVADYAPAQPSRRKIKGSRTQRVLRLRPNPDVLASLARGRRRDQLAIGFALEDRSGRRNARGKLAAKRLDAIVLNTPRAINATESSVQVLDREGWVRLPQAGKARTARTLIALIERLAERVRGTR